MQPDVIERIIALCHGRPGATFALAGMMRSLARDIDDVDRICLARELVRLAGELDPDQAPRLDA